jgi:protein TonB
LTAAVALNFPRQEEYTDTLERESRVLYTCIAVSLLLHLVMLSIHFRLPQAVRQQANLALDVILVNSKTRERPSKPEALAQANLDGGGNTDANRRARTPLPVTNPNAPGRDLAEAQRRVQQLEAQQQKLMTQSRASPATVPVEAPRPAPDRETAPATTGRDLADLALATMRLQAQIDRRVDEYQKRPRKQFIGARASEYRFAQYEEDWRMKVERFGTLNYPPEARGRYYGTLRLTVTLRADGTVESVELDKSSGLQVLDQAAFRIVRMAAPYAAFPPEIRKDTDQLVITRTWFFGQGDKVWTE